MTAATQELDVSTSNPAYQETEQRLADLEAQSLALRQTGMDAYLSHDPETRGAIDAMLDSYDGLAIEDGEEALLLSAYARQAGNVPEDIVQLLASEESLSNQIQAAEAEREMYAPEKAQDLLAEFSELESRIDYDAVANYIGHKPSGAQQDAQIHTLIAARKLLATSTSLSYSQLITLEHTVHGYVQPWTEQGFLLSEGEQQPMSEQLATTLPGSKSEYIALADSFIEAYTLAKKFGNIYTTGDVVEHEMALLRQLDEVLGWTDDFTVVDVLQGRVLTGNVAFRNALERSMNANLTHHIPPEIYATNPGSEAYGKIVERARSIDVEKALNDLKIEGELEDLPFSLTSEEIKQFLKATMPPMALAHTRRIEFRPFTKEEDPKGNTGGHNYRDKDLNGNVIAINTTPFKRILSVAMANPDVDLLEAGRFIKEEMLKALSHELAHTLHNVLPLAALTQWQRDIAGDQIHVTSYVKRSHDENHPHDASEDFADSVSMFIDEPEVLKAVSKQRLLAVQRIYRTFMPDYVNALWRKQVQDVKNWELLQERGGSSEEQLREEHLGHETPERRHAKSTIDEAAIMAEFMAKFLGRGFNGVSNYKNPEHAARVEVNRRAGEGEALKSIKRDMAKRFSNGGSGATGASDPEGFKEMTAAIQDLERQQK